MPDNSIADDCVPRLISADCPQGWVPIRIGSGAGEMAVQIGSAVFPPVWATLAEGDFRPINRIMDAASAPRRSNEQTYGSLLPNGFKPTERQVL